MNGLDPYFLWDAAYVLGSLSAAQRREYEPHLSRCPACQRQVAELSGMPGLLALLREEERPMLVAENPGTASAPAPLYAGLAARVARRRRRFSLAAAAAAIVLAGSTAAITAGLTSGAATVPSAIGSASVTSPLTFTGDASASGLAATGSLASYSWGTQISWRCSYVADSRYTGQRGKQEYVLVMVSTGAPDTAVASWTAGPGSVVAPTAATSLPVHSIARLDIRDSTGATLLSAVPSQTRN